ncbi:MAG: hypothetical protein O2921_11315, partial [Chloroflexi bacterium]|nr:hypothetical protein [Chloroflexota bacterium]
HSACRTHRHHHSGSVDVEDTRSWWSTACKNFESSTLGAPASRPRATAGGWQTVLGAGAQVGGVGFVVLTLALFVYLVIFGLESDLTDAQVTQTQVARNSDD